ncbi:LacI family transcriptional regulator [Devosia sp.]|uniref:LacI family transcriptional regulator n=1 Tax=Devosia sp. TaxID=1871048 RepID=UPI003BA9A422
MTKTGKPADGPSQSGGRATLKTIAQMTGLSLSTVSLSLRGGSTLKEETRLKVAEAARAVGYVPDRAGVRLRTGKTNVIALVLDGAEDSINYASHLIRGIGNAIAGTRYHLTVMPEFERTDTVETIKYILDGRTADGVIITHTSPRDRRVQLLLDADFPFVSHGRTDFFDPHPFHDYHSEAFVTLGVARLVARGCRRLMLIAHDDRTSNHHNIVTTFMREAAKAGLDAEVVEGRIAGGEVPQMRDFGQQLGRRDNRPDGILCDSELRAIALISGLQDQGVMLGAGVEVISKETSGMLAALFPKADSIEEDVYAAGRELTRLLMLRISGEDPQKLQTLGEPIPRWRS